MAKYVVPPKNEVIVKCRKCGTLYVPEHGESHGTGHLWEDCPYCGYFGNRKADEISLWRYNFIKWIRGGFKNA